jgi:hypothetical protein
MYQRLSTNVFTKFPLTELGKLAENKTDVHISSKFPVQYVIIIQKANTKSSAGQHGPTINAKVGSGSTEE